MPKQWGGRFKEKNSLCFEEFSESVSFDYRLAGYDIKGTLCHSAMLKKIKILKQNEFQKIKKGLNEILKEIQAGKFKFKKELEDVHTNIENALYKKIGEAALKIHTGRSRNDQVLTDVYLYLRDEVAMLRTLLLKNIKEAARLAKKYKNILMPGFTHLQHAQAVSAGHYFCMYGFYFLESIKRIDVFKEKILEMPLGSAALAGTSIPIDRDFTAKLLGFKTVSRNSMHAVSRRDIISEYMFILADISVTLSRMAEDLIIYNSSEFSYITLSDKVTTGSSIMPQKKNPDSLELIRGKAAGVIADLNGVLILQKGLPFSYNRDLQEDKLYVFKSTENIKGCLSVLEEVFKGVKLNAVNLERSLEKGYLWAADFAEHLALKGMPFRKCHEVTGKLVAYMEDKNKNILDITEEEIKKITGVKLNKDIFSLKKGINNKKSKGSTAPAEVEKQIKYLSSVR